MAFILDKEKYEKCLSIAQKRTKREYEDYNKLKK